MRQARSRGLGDYLGLVLAIELGSLVRLLPVVIHGFPLNDGGLFYRMTEDLVSNGFRLPLMTSYNGGGIPFAYPPSGFYLAGGLHVATGAPLLELMRWMPALFSILTIPAFYLLARQLLPSTRSASMAALVFSLIPRSFEWIVMGGGLTRSPGMLFAILALYATLRLLDHLTWRATGVLGLLLALVALSHLELAWFTVSSLLLFVALKARTRAVFVRLALALGGAALLSGLWWIPFLTQHGVAPLMQAAFTGQHTSTSTAAILTGLTGEPFQGVFLVLGILGAIACLSRRSFLLPAWLAMTILLDPRAAGTDTSLSIGMLVAITISEVVLPSLATPAGIPSAAEGQTPLEVPRGRDSHVRGHRLALGAIACYGVCVSALAPFLPGSGLLASLRPGELEAMHWADARLPAGNTFLIVSGRSAWEADPLSEWFPALTDQVSLATPQGKEWVGGLEQAGVRHRALQLCAERGLQCLEEWLDAGEARSDYLLVARYPAGYAIQTVALEEGLSRTHDYTLVYSNAEAVIYSHSPEP